MHATNIGHEAAHSIVQWSEETLRLSAPITRPKASKGDPKRCDGLYVSIGGKFFNVLGRPVEMEGFSRIVRVAGPRSNDRPLAREARHSNQRWRI
jgi:hypothetical protein